MILSNDRIRALLLNDSSPLDDRLVISPILNWNNQIKPGGSSVDVRLGQRFRVPRRTKLDRLDHLSDAYIANVERYKDDYHVLLGDYFVIHPRQFVLGNTLEWIHLPPNLAAYVIGRSSWGRDGLVIATATGVHPRYSGVLTLEITNLGEIPVRLYPGLTIAQLFIHQVEGHVSAAIQGQAKGEATPSFTGSTNPENADAAGSDKRIIRKIATERGFRHPD
jgi:dCTP deaminase